jgi:hypothetical protein
MKTCDTTTVPSDAVPASHAMRLDRHIASLLAPFDPNPEQPPLVALAYWGVNQLMDDNEQAQRLREVIDELAALPNDKLVLLLRQAHLTLDQDLSDSAASVLFWLTEYAHLTD